MTPDGLDAFGEFFKNPDLVDVVDFMAQRYHKLPHEILRDITVADFNLNVAIMLAAMKRDAARRKGEKPTRGLKGMGFKVQQVPRSGAS